MEKEKMGIDPDTHHTNTDRTASSCSRVASTGAASLYSVLKGSGSMVLKGGIFFIPTLVFIILLEILFRLLNVPPYPLHRAQGLYVQNDYSNFALNTEFSGLMSNLEYLNHVYVDSLGFRNLHTGEVKVDSHKKRILVLGDSMTFGQGVEYQDTFTGLLAHNTKYQVFNAGVPSYGTIHSLGLLKHIGSQISPNVVMYFFYPGNDFYDNKMGFSKHVVEGLLTENSNFKPSTLTDEGQVDYPAYSEKVYLGSVDKFLLHTSYFYKFLRYKASFVPSIREIYTKKRIIRLSTCALPYSPSPFSKTYTKEQEYDNTISVILDMKNFVEEKLNATFVLVHMPVREQVNAKLLDYEKKQNCVKSKDFDSRNPDKFLLTFSRKHNIRFIDITESLQKSFDDGKDPFYIIDTHLNSRGHRVIYELLSTKIQKYFK